MADQPMAYIARASCGCIRMAAVDELKYAKTTAQEVAACIKLGWTIERVTCAYVREHGLASCDQCKPQRNKRPATKQETMNL